MDEIINFLTTFPTELDLVSMLKYIGIFAGIVLIVGVLARMILGKRSSLNHSVSSALGILCIYALTGVIYTFDPYDLSKFLTPLPFVSFAGDYLYVLDLAGLELPAICYEVLSMVILAFLVNLLDTWIPKGSKVIGWYGYRLLTVILAMGLHYGVTWLINTYLPGTLVTYAPMILLGILAAMILLGFLNIVLSLVLTVVNPIIGALYTFFFSNIFGKQITKAVITTILLCIFVIALNYIGYTVIPLSAASFMSNIPLIGTVLILWYIIGHVL